MRTHYDEDEERPIVAVLSFLHRFGVGMYVSELVLMVPLDYLALLEGKPNEQVE